jgi:hypothetical protein
MHITKTEEIIFGGLRYQYHRFNTGHELHTRHGYAVAYTPRGNYANHVTTCKLEAIALETQRAKAAQ